MGSASGEVGLMAAYTLPSNETSVFDVAQASTVSGYSSVDYSPDTSTIAWFLSPSFVFDYFPTSGGGGGGGSARPTSGMLYPRGQG